jgi:hypothetical protein
MRPSFETRAGRAPQDEDWLAANQPIYSANRGTLGHFRFSEISLANGPKSVH